MSGETPVFSGEDCPDVSPDVLKLMKLKLLDMEARRVRDKVNNEFIEANRDTNDGTDKLPEDKL